jgi:hypothetical protein
VIGWRRCSCSPSTWGLRQAELLGLRWADVDLAVGRPEGRLEVLHSLQRVDG